MTTKASLPTTKSICPTTSPTKKTVTAFPANFLIQKNVSANFVKLHGSLKPKSAKAILKLIQQINKELTTTKSKSKKSLLLTEKCALVMVYIKDLKQMQFYRIVEDQ